MPWLQRYFLSLFQLEIPVDIDTEFCDINANGCVSTQPSCDERGAGGGIQEFCSCSTLEVPEYAPVGLNSKRIVFGIWNIIFHEL